MIYVYGIVLLAVGAFLALKGLSNYRLFLSGAVTLSNAMFYLGMADLQPDVVSPTTGIIVALIGGGLTYLLYKLVTYVWTWYFLFMSLALVTAAFVGMESMSGGMVGALLLVPIVITFLMRKHIKPVLIGLMSGFSVGAGVATIIVASMIANASLDSDFMTMIKVPSFALLALTLGGVAFQYLVVLKKNPELAQV